ncbi:RNA polymerase sigma factor [Nocardiopsis metallicus]|uniref:Uncharacterized protein n=1 Tax=Nocardiopsis metallicus TaxID=179819 RepID=A0A840WRR3_9ACTN|nr:sigma-70 family RNA polymerase sigma factor [Nocardiopsis metallicus]MBB5494595.1 hypothetical protein [Nocardiopsis metallicus]
MTDRDLLYVLSSGRVPPADAYSRLLDAYGEELYRRCILVLRDRDAAHVVLRDTLIVARAHIGRLPDPELLGEWLHAVTEAECVRYRQLRAPWPGDCRPLSLPERTEMVRARVLNGMSGPELHGYRIHVAARADRFGDDGFPLRPETPRFPAGLSPVPLVVAVLCALLVLALAGYALVRDPVHELGTDEVLLSCGDPQGAVRA